MNLSLSLLRFPAVFALSGLISVPVSALAGSYGTAEASPSSLSWAGTETKESQAALTATEALQRLMDGNARFASGVATQRDLLAQAEATAGGQYPYAAILGCVDSRVPIEMVFDLGIGDAFAARVAGNIAPEDMIGSMEFATAVAGAKVILVVGHTACGAVKGAIDQVELSKLTGLLEQIEPAVQEVSPGPGESRSSKYPSYVNRVAEQNVRDVIANVLAESEIIAGLVESGDVIVAGGMYDLESGVVTFLE